MTVASSFTLDRTYHSLCPLLFVRSLLKICSCHLNLNKVWLNWCLHLLGAGPQHTFITTKQEKIHEKGEFIIYNYQYEALHFKVLLFLCLFIWGTYFMLSQITWQICYIYIQEIMQLSHSYIISTEYEIKVFFSSDIMSSAVQHLKRIVP